MYFDIITPSHRLDFHRCQMLCESIDRFVKGPFHHLIVVIKEDYSHFRALRSGCRDVIEAESILPKWLWPTGIRRRGTRYWFSAKSLPLSGWHIQQMIKITLAHLSTAEVLLFADSEVFFVRPFEIGRVIRQDKVRLHRIANAISSKNPLHWQWCHTAAALLGIPRELSPPVADYVNQLITWRRQNALALCNHIETVTGNHWAIALARARSFSEYITYGMFVDTVLGDRSQHYWVDIPLCHTYWEYEPLTQEALSDFTGALTESQVAICIQSVSRTPFEIVRRCYSQISQLHDI